MNGRKRKKKILRNFKFISANFFEKIQCLPVDIYDGTHHTYEFVGWISIDFVWTMPK